MGIFCMSSMRCIFLFFFLYITRFFVGKNKAIAEPRKSTTNPTFLEKLKSTIFANVLIKPLAHCYDCFKPGTFSNKPLATGPQAIVNFAVL